MSGIRAAMAALLLVAARQDEPPPLEKLIEQLSNEWVEEREAAVDALGRLDPQILPMLRSRLQGLGPEPRLRLAEAIRRLEESVQLLEFFPPYRPVTLRLDHQFSTLALQELAEQTGLPIDLANCPNGREVTVDLEGRTPLEALQAICREARLGWSLEGIPDWRGRSRGPFPPRVRIREVVESYPQPRPVAYVRHYEIAAELGGATQVQFVQKQSLNLWIKTTPGVRPHSLSSVRVTALTDKDGKDLLPSVLPARKGFREVGMFERSIGERVIFATSDGFPTGISRLAGTMTFRYPKGLKWVRFSKLRPPYTEVQEALGLRFALVTYERYGNLHRVDVDLSWLTGGAPTLLDLDRGKPFDSMEFDLISARGEHLVSCGNSGNGYELVSRMSYDFKGTREEDAVELRLATADRFVEDVVEFELRDIR